jgi:hypothetical protein
VVFSSALRLETCSVGVVPHIFLCPEPDAKASARKSINVSFAADMKIIRGDPLYYSYRYKEWRKSNATNKTGRTITITLHRLRTVQLEI